MAERAEYIGRYDGIDYDNAVENTNRNKAELEDMRAGADGTIYSTAGEALRGEIGKLSDDIDSRIAKTESKNLWNPDTCVVGMLSRDAISQKNGWMTSDFIKAVKGKKLTASIGGEVQPIRFVTWYDSDKNYVLHTGTAQTMFTIPETADYIRCTLSKEIADNNVMLEFTDDGAPTSYEPYFDTKYDFCDNGIKKVNARIDEAESNFLIEKSVRNLFDNRCFFKGFLKNDGSISANNSFFTTDFIPVEKGGILSAFVDGTRVPMRFILRYDANQQLSDLESQSYIILQNQTSYNIESGVSFVKITLSNDYFDNLMLELTDDGLPHSYVDYKKPTSDFSDNRILLMENNIKKIENDMLRTDKAIKKPHFGWIDDDGKAYVFNLLYPWAVQNNVPFTSALISNYIRDVKPGWMSVGQVQQMYAEHPELVSFGSHTRDHINANSMQEDDIENQIKGSKNDITSWGLPCDVMVYPNGQLKDSELDSVRRYYSYGFQAGGANGAAGTRVNYPPIGTYKLMRRSLSQASNLELIKLEIDLTIENNGLLIFMTHTGSADAYNTDVSAEYAVYDEVLSYIRAKGYDFEPIKTICDIHRNLIELGNYSSTTPGGYFVIGADGSIVSDTDGNKQIYSVISRVMDLEERVSSLESAD